MSTTPFSGRAYRAYLQERFPPAQNALALFLLYTCTMLAAVTLRGYASPNLATYILGYVWTVGVFYHLRVLDDLKDRTADIAAYPERVLSRGALTYRQLALTGILTIALETAIALYMGPKILALHMATLAYSLLMYREFFIRIWLREHLFWYGLVHMLVLSFIDFTILQMADARGPVAHDPGYFLFAFLSFFMTFSLEVARKIRVPEAERPEVDTYSQAVGVGGAMMLSSLFQAAVLIIAWMLRGSLSLPPWFFALSGVAWAVVAGFYLIWRPQLTPARSLRLDKVASIFFLTFYLSLLGSLAWRLF